MGGMEPDGTRPRTGRRNGAAVLLAALVVAALWLVSGCGGPAPARLTVAQLTFGQEDYDGREVRTAGVVRRFGAAEGATQLHYVVEDGAANRVKLLGGDVARYEGRTVEVVGRFHFSESAGRTLDVEEIVTR